MSVHMDEVQAAAKAVLLQRAVIAGYLQGIEGVLGRLALAWTGGGDGAADRAQAAARAWSTVMAGLYGTENDPDAGSLNMLCGGLGKVVSNFVANEWAISQMFGQFYLGMTGAPPAAGVTPPDSRQSVADGPAGPPGSSSLYHFTAVNEFTPDSRRG